MIQECRQCGSDCVEDDLYIVSLNKVKDNLIQGDLMLCTWVCKNCIHKEKWWNRLGMEQ